MKQKANYLYQYQCVTFHNNQTMTDDHMTDEEAEFQLGLRIYGTEQHDVHIQIRIHIANATFLCREAIDLTWFVRISSLLWC